MFQIFYLPGGPDYTISELSQSALPRVYCSSKLFKNVLCYRRFGVAGLYKGMEAKVIQTVLAAALMFTVYEKIANFVFKIMLTQSRA